MDVSALDLACLHSLKPTFTLRPQTRFPRGEMAPSQTTVLCQRCESILLEELTGAHLPIRFFGHVLHETADSFLGSVALGCDFCSLINATLCALDGRNSLGYETAPPARIELSLVLNRASHRTIDAWPADGWLNLDVRDDKRETICRFRVTPHLPAVGALLADEYADAQLSHARSSWGPFNARLAHLWKDDCLEHHVACQLTVTSEKLPSRLVDLVGSQPVLINTCDAGFEPGPYAALSYCWGQGERFRTLKANVEAHRRSIPVESLPATFKDALDVARALHYRYLWIDALCIVQDDEDDMRREILRMGDVYRHADLTIAARGAAGVHDGLYQHFTPFSKPCRLTVRIQPYDRPQFEGQLTFALDTNLPPRVPNQLARRGWTLQETLLSRRELAFAGQITWRCMAADVAETTPVPAAPAGFGETNRASLQPWIHGTLPLNQAGGYYRWYQTVEDYTRRELAFPADRLRALAGIAAVLSQNNATTYLAGAWKEDLADGLAWFVLGPLAPVSTHMRGRAPTWSWASARQGPVRFMKPPWYYFGASEQVPELATLAGAFCPSLDPINMPAPAAVPGHGRSWGLTFSAVLKRAVLEYELGRYTDSVSLKKISGLTYLEDYSGVAAIREPSTNGKFRPQGFAVLDCPIEATGVMGNPVKLLPGPDKILRLDVFCLPLLRTPYDPDDGLWMISMVLVRHDGDSGDAPVYSRIALAWVPAEWWYEGDERELCEII